MCFIEKNRQPKLILHVLEISTQTQLENVRISQGPQLYNQAPFW